MRIRYWLLIAIGLSMAGWAASPKIEDVEKCAAAKNGLSYETCFNNIMR